MSALVGSRSTRSPGLRRAVVASLAVLLGLSFGAQHARADQPVSFDGPAGAAEISLIGDSTLTGVRWYADYGELRQYDFLLDAESCRRTIGQSCISREGYRSETVLAAMNTHRGQLGEVLVVMAGYNDPDWTIEDSIALVTAEARSQGVRHVVWLTLRTSDDVDYSDPQEGSSTNTFRLYNEALTAAAAESGGFLQIADWATYSAGASSWFEADGVHLTPAGVDALTEYLASVVGRVLSGENVSPDSAPWTVLMPGTAGEVVAAVQSALMEAGIEVPGGADGIYGNDTMAAVAAYQERSQELQVTGAVDVATARALGVLPESAPEVGEVDSATADDAAATPDLAGATPSGAVDAPSSTAAGGSGLTWLLTTAVLAAAVGGAVVARRRAIVARRRERRQARVHPATSPHRRVADLRRSGELPAVGPIGRGEQVALFDREMEPEDPAGVSAHTADGSSRSIAVRPPSPSP